MDRRSSIQAQSLVSCSTAIALVALLRIHSTALFISAKRVWVAPDRVCCPWLLAATGSTTHARSKVPAPEYPRVRTTIPGEIPFFVSVRGEDGAEITGYWKKLCEGSTIIRQLEPAGWATLYGMVKDRFGVTWVLDEIGRAHV